MPIEEMRQRLNSGRVPDFEATASAGQGVFETLKMISKLVLLNIKGGLD